MGISNRIKQLRKELGLSQKAFGDKLGVSRDVINNIDNGRVEPTELIIKVICREFNASYEWLKNGSGDMWLSSDDESIGAIVDEIMDGENETAKAIFKAFAKFDDRDWLTIQKVINEIQKK